MTTTLKLHVTSPSGIERTFEVNGVPEDRAAAKAAFDEMMNSGYYLAAVETSPGRLTQIRTFEDAEKIEKEKGEVSVQLTPGLQGG